MKKYEKEKHELYRQNIMCGFSISEAWRMAQETVDMWEYFDGVEMMDL